MYNSDNYQQMATIQSFTYKRVRSNYLHAIVRQEGTTIACLFIHNPRGIRIEGTRQILSQRVIIPGNTDVLIVYQAEQPEMLTLCFQTYTPKVMLHITYIHTIMYYVLYQRVLLFCERVVMNYITHVVVKYFVEYI